MEGQIDGYVDKKCFENRQIDGWTDMQIDGWMGG